MAAGGQQTETNVVATELERVDTVVPVMFDRDDMFFSFVEKRPVEVMSARDMRVPMELRPGGRFKAFDDDGGDLGRGTGIEYDKAVVNTVKLALALEWTKKAEWATDSNRKAVINTTRRQMAKAMKEFRRHVDALAMTGGDAVVGTVSAVATAGGKDTITLNQAGDGFHAKLLRYQNFYSIYDSTLATRRTFTGGASESGYAPIDLYDLAAKQVRFNGSTGATVAGDKVVIEGYTATPPSSLQGVSYHHSDASSGTWLGYTRSATPEIRANRVTAGGPLALPFPRLALNKIGDRLGEDVYKNCVAWMHPCQKQAYEELGQLASIIQKQPRAEALDMYFGDNMQLAGAPIKAHYMWDKTRIDFVDKSVWGRAEMHPAGVYSVDGRKIWEVRGSSGGVATAQIYYIVVSFNFYVNNPAACSYISGLTIPSGY